MELGDGAYRGSDWLAALHAGGVHDGRRALALPALGGTGKTTLTAALVAAGLGYLSDDVIPLQRITCEAMALPLPLRVRDSSLPLLRAFWPGLDRQPTYGSFGQAVHLLSPSPGAVGPAERTYPVAALVFLARERSRVQPELEAVAPAEALQHLLASDTLLRRPLIAADIAELLAWLERTPAHWLRYGALAPAVTLLMGLLE
jgi:hypothetical protein